MAGLNYMFIRNLHVWVFLTFKTEIMTTSNEILKLREMLQMLVHFSTDPTNISSNVEIGIGYKSIVKLKFCAQPSCIKLL